MKPERTIAFLLVAACCGCTMHRITMRPGVSGLVLNARTGKGIQGADVCLSNRTSGEFACCKTKADGSFSIHPQRKQHIHWLAAPIEDYPVVDCTLEAQVAGFRPASGEFRILPMFGPVSTNLGEIRLEPSPE